MHVCMSACAHLARFIDPGFIPAWHGRSAARLRVHCRDESPVLTNHGHMATWTPVSSSACVCAPDAHGRPRGHTCMHTHTHAYTHTCTWRPWKATWTPSSSSGVRRAPTAPPALPPALPPARPPPALPPGTLLLGVSSCSRPCCAAATPSSSIRLESDVLICSAPPLWCDVPVCCTADTGWSAG